MDITLSSHGRCMVITWSSHGHYMVITWSSHGHHMGIMESSYTIMSSYSTLRLGHRMVIPESSYHDVMSSYYSTLRLGSPAAPRVSTSGLQSKAECSPCFHLRLHLSQNSWDCWVSPCGVYMHIPVRCAQQLCSCVYAMYCDSI